MALHAGTAHPPPRVMAARYPRRDGERLLLNFGTPMYHKGQRHFTINVEYAAKDGDNPALQRLYARLLTSNTGVSCIELGTATIVYIDHDGARGRTEQIISAVQQACHEAGHSGLAVDRVWSEEWN